MCLTDGLQIIAQLAQKGNLDLLPPEQRMLTDLTCRWSFVCIVTYHALHQIMSIRYSCSSTLLLLLLLFSGSGSGNWWH